MTDKLTFKEKILTIQSEPLSSIAIEALQVNLGYRCNLACKHCHVQAGPERKEMMDKKTVEGVLGILRQTHIKTIDITGGAPEMNPTFRYLVKEAGKIGCHIILRTNLTICFEKGMEYLFNFYKQHNIEITASFPYYNKDCFDKVRGNGTFQKAIKALNILNRSGYGIDSSAYKLNLVYNPVGAFLPPAQATLEKEYRTELLKHFSVSFSNLYIIANMPVGRFKDFLIRTKNLEQYMCKLQGAFNPETLGGIMCRHIINVGWNGLLYDCDFNQMIGQTVLANYPLHIAKFDYSILSVRKIAMEDHCFGCTAGQGST